VLQEVLELFPEESSVAEQESSSSLPAELHLLAAVTELKDPGTLTFQLTGSVQNQQIQFLVDSGSTHSFINAKFAPLFTGVSDMAAPLRVKVANGEQLQCTKTLIACPWSCQGHVFTT
jgi:predicted aspartyl protease